MIPLQPIRVSLPAGADVKPRLNIAPIRVTQYEASYQRLFNGNVIYPHGRGTSFVSHSMIIKRTYMLEMLQTIAGPGNDVHMWPWLVLDSIAASAAPGLGFSEYTLYSSFVMRHKPGAYIAAEERDFVRLVPGDHLLTKMNHSDCCPDRQIIDKLHLASPETTYVGWELGHAGAKCSQD